MKAIYINIDPYLQSIADWLNAGKPGTAPSFDPLPVAVTIPLGETAVFFMQTGTFADGALLIADADSEADFGWNAGASNAISDDADPRNQDATGGEADGIALSSVLQSQKTYWGHIGAVDSFEAYVNILTSEYEDFYRLKVPVVLVRRETASGPVDVVDFMPPAATPTAADIKSALVAAGDGALAGVSLGGAYLRVTNEKNTPTNPTYGVYGDEPFDTETGSTFSIQESADITTPLGNTSAS